MKTIKFKTNINCGGCVASVTPLLNELAGEKQWHVDINHPDKILEVKSDSLTAEVIIEKLVGIGYKAKMINN